MRRSRGSPKPCKHEFFGGILTDSMALKAVKRDDKVGLKGAAAVERKLQGFINKFDPENAALIRTVRKELRKRLPAANELVYDNYNFFVIGYSSTERPSDCIGSHAGAVGGPSTHFRCRRTGKDAVGGKRPGESDHPIDLRKATTAPESVQIALCSESNFQDGERCILFVDREPRGVRRAGQLYEQKRLDNWRAVLSTI